MEKARRRPYLVKGSKDATKPLRLDASKILASDIGNEFSFSFWVYVKDWGHNFSLPKHVFHIGDADAQKVFPGIWLYPKNNNLMVRMDTYNRLNNVNKTKSGLECQNWTSSFPHKNDAKHTRAWCNVIFLSLVYCKDLQLKLMKSDHMDPMMRLDLLELLQPAIHLRVQRKPNNHPWMHVTVNSIES